MVVEPTPTVVAFLRQAWSVRDSPVEESQTRAVFFNGPHNIASSTPWLTPLVCSKYLSVTLELARRAGQIPATLHSHNSTFPTVRQISLGNLYLSWAIFLARLYRL